MGVGVGAPSYTLSAYAVLWLGAPPLKAAQGVGGMIRNLKLIDLLRDLKGCRFCRSYEDLTPRLKQALWEILSLIRQSDTPPEDAWEATLEVEKYFTSLPRSFEPYDRLHERAQKDPAMAQYLHTLARERGLLPRFLKGLDGALRGRGDRGATYRAWPPRGWSTADRFLLEGHFFPLEQKELAFVKRHLHTIVQGIFWWKEGGEHSYSPQRFLFRLLGEALKAGVDPSSLALEEREWEELLLLLPRLDLLDAPDFVPHFVGKGRPWAEIFLGVFPQRSLPEGVSSPLFDLREAVRLWRSGEVQGEALEELVAAGLAQGSWERVLTRNFRNYGQGPYTHITQVWEEEGWSEAFAGPFFPLAQRLAQKLPPSLLPFLVALLPASLQPLVEGRLKGLSPEEADAFALSLWSALDDWAHSLPVRATRQLEAMGLLHLATDREGKWTAHFTREGLVGNRNRYYRLRQLLLPLVEQLLESFSPKYRREVLLEVGEALSLEVLTRYLEDPSPLVADAAYRLIYERRYRALAQALEEKGFRLPPAKRLPPIPFSKARKGIPLLESPLPQYLPYGKDFGVVWLGLGRAILVGRSWDTHFPLEKDLPTHPDGSVALPAPKAVEVLVDDAFGLPRGTFRVLAEEAPGGIFPILKALRRRNLSQALHFALQYGEDPKRMRKRLEEVLLRKDLLEI